MAAVISGTSGAVNGGPCPCCAPCTCPGIAPDGPLATAYSLTIPAGSITVGGVVVAWDTQTITLDFGGTNTLDCQWSSYPAVFHYTDDGTPMQSYPHLYLDTASTPCRWTLETDVTEIILLWTKPTGATPVGAMASTQGPADASVT